MLMALQNVTRNRKQPSGAMLRRSTPSGVQGDTGKTRERARAKAKARVKVREKEKETKKAKPKEKAKAKETTKVQ